MEALARRVRRGGPTGTALALAVPVGLVVAGVAVPLVYLVLRASEADPGVLADLVWRPRTLRLVRNTLGLAAAVVALLLEAPTWVVLVLATLAPLVGSVFRPAQLAWLPSLAAHPAQLTAANGASSTIDSLSFLLGPALGGLVVATTSVETMFVVTAVMFLVAAALVLRTGVVPPTAGLANPEPCRRLHLGPARLASAATTVAAVTSFGFGGNSCTLVLGRVAS